MASRDGCVVDSQPLAGILIPFIDEWVRERPSTGGRFERGARTEVESVTATGWLSQETGISERTIQNLTRRDESGSPAPQAKTTELRIADPLVAAVGRPEVFYDGTLEIRENPLAKKNVRAACCSSSKLRF